MANDPFVRVSDFIHAIGAVETHIHACHDTLDKFGVKLTVFGSRINGLQRRIELLEAKVDLTERDRENLARKRA